MYVYIQEPIRRIVDLKPGVTYLYRQHCARCNPNEKNSAVMNLYSVCREISQSQEGGSGSAQGGDGIQQEALLELLCQLLSEPSFDQLRTKEQLGYIVNTATTITGQTSFLRIIVQSNSRDAQYLDDRIELFLQGYRDTLAQMGAEELHTNVCSTVEKLLEKPKNIDEESGRHWEEVDSGMYVFDRRQLKAGYLSRGDGITIPLLLEFYDRHILNKDTRIKFSSQFFGAGKKYPRQTAGGAGSTVLITEPGVFKRSMHLLDIKTAASK